MNAAIWLTGLTALVGVWFGGLLSSRAQDRAWRREEARLWREARRAAYGALVASVREYRLYVSGPHARIEVWARPGRDGTEERLIPGIGAEGAKYQEAMESAFTDVQMIAHGQETIDRAHLLTSIARRVAVARAVHGAGDVPSDLDESLFVAERAFVNSARRDLGLLDVNPPPFPDVLWQIDVSLRQAYRDRSAGSPPDSTSTA